MVELPPFYPINAEVLDDLKLRFSRGRIEIKIDGKWRTRSRVLVELCMSRPLVKTEVVHHFDENKLNDSLSNLGIMSLSEHISYHNQKRDWTHLRERCGDKNPNWKGGKRRSVG